MSGRVVVNPVSRIIHLESPDCRGTCGPVPAEAEQLAQRFHETYESLAPKFGYETRKESAVEWKDVPDKNRCLMIATCASLLQGGYINVVVPREAV